MGSFGECINALTATVLMVILTVVALATTTSDPRPAATLAILAVQQLTWSLPVAIGNDAAGFNYCGPLTIPATIAATLWAATHLGIRRLAQT